MHWVSRTAAGVIWLLAAGITLVLLYEFTEGAGGVYFAMMIFAMLLASFCLVFARIAFKNGNWLSGLFSGLAWVVGVAVLFAMELGYWDSKQEFTSSAHKTESLASSGRQNLAANAQASLEGYKTARPSGEVLAERDAILRKVIDRAGNTVAKATRYCADPSDHPKECGDYAKLGVELARSKEKERLEKQVWESATGPQVVVRTFDISAPAHLISRWTGISEDVTKDFLKGIFSLLLFIGRDGMLFVASAPRKRAGGFIQLGTIETAKVARSEPEPAQIMQPDPVPQISAPKASEPAANKEEPASLPTSLLQSLPVSRDVSKDVSEDVEKPIDRRKVKKQERKRLGKNVLPFDAGSARSSKRTLHEAVAAWCNANEGKTIPFSAIRSGVASYAPRGTKIAANRVGPILKELGHEWCKPGNVVHYRIAGGSERTAIIA